MTYQPHQTEDATTKPVAAGKTMLRKLPAVEPRVESGATQFGDDWPGVFIRGDNAFGYAMALRALRRGTADPFTLLMLDGLIAVLASSDLTGISQRDTHD